MPDVNHLLKDLYHALDPETRQNIALVGGQALWIWGTYYLLDEMTGEERAYLASDDIDFLGRNPEIDQCAKAWHQEPHRPDPSDPTPHTAIFLLDHDLEERPLFDSKGERTEITVDFLNHVHGLKELELKNGFDALILEDDFRPRLLTPALCLKSRYHNLYSLPYGPDRKPREIVRANLAANATRYYLLDLLEHHKTKRKALKWANVVLDLANSPPGIQMSVKHGLEPLNSIPEKHAGFGDKFTSGHYAAMFEKIMRKRASYQRRLEELADYSGPQP